MFESLKPSSPHVRQLLRLANPPQPAAKPAIEPPRLLTASEALKLGMNRQLDALNNRERVLRAEIAAREAELADVVHTARAAQAALMELDITDAVIAEALHTD
mgnify:CR=1 FL=1